MLQSYDVLPDDEAWPNNYILLRFPERPSAATATVSLKLPVATYNRKHESRHFKAHARF